MLVSSGSGRPDRLFDRRTSDGTSEPVKTKFLASKTTPLSVSQVVAGSAPMKREDMADRLLRLLAGDIIAPAYALQLLFQRFPFGSILRYCRSPRCGR